MAFSTVPTQEEHVIPVMRIVATLAGAHSMVSYNSSASKPIVSTVSAISAAVAGAVKWISARPANKLTDALDLAGRTTYRQQKLSLQRAYNLHLLHVSQLQHTNTRLGTHGGQEPKNKQTMINLEKP